MNNDISKVYLEYLEQPDGKKDRVVAAYIVLNNGKINRMQITDKKQSAEEFKKEVLENIRNGGFNQEDLTNPNKTRVLYDYYDELNNFKEDNNIVDEPEFIGYKDLEYEEKIKEKIKKKTPIKGLIFGVALTLLAGVGGYHLVNRLNNKKEETEIEETFEGYGYYKFNILGYNLEKYNELLPIIEQKTGTNLHYDILSGFNTMIETVDGTKILSGLTTEDIVAIDAYANSNIYEDIDYIKHFGLYDLSGVSNQLTLAIQAAGAHLSNENVDGDVLADIFKDPVVRKSYLAQNDYLKRIKAASTRKEQKKIFAEWEKYIDEVSLLTISDNYIDYSQHPGMLFVTTAFATSFEYHNLYQNNTDIQKMILIGNEDYQSKINSVCSNALAKLENAQELITYTKQQLDQELPINEEVRETLDKVCDQEHIIAMLDRELSKSNLKVTPFKQERALKEVLKKGIESKKEYDPLKNGSLTVTTPQKEVSQEKIDEQISKGKLSEQSIKNFEQAVEEADKKTGDVNSSTEGGYIESLKEEAQKTQEEYENIIINYYAANGDVGMPASLTDAYNKLGEYLFNTARSTGIDKYKFIKDGGNPEIGGSVESGGEDQIYDEYQGNVDFNAQQNDTSTITQPPADNTTPPTVEDTILPPVEDTTNTNDNNTIPLDVDTDAKPGDSTTSDESGKEIGVFDENGNQMLSTLSFQSFVNVLDAEELVALTVETDDSDIYDENGISTTSFESFVDGLDAEELAALTVENDELSNEPTIQK